MIMGVIMGPRCNERSVVRDRPGGQVIILLFAAGCQTPDSASLPQTEGGEMLSTQGDQGSSGTTTSMSDSDGSGDSGCMTSLTLAESYSLSSRPLGQIRVFDVDSDGVTDVVGGTGTIIFRREGGFEERSIANFPQTNSARPGLFNSDTMADLIAIEGGGGAATPGTIRTFLGVGLDGLPPVETPVETPVPAAWNYDVRDVDGDGVDDVSLLVAGAGTTVEIWRGTGSGAFELGSQIDLLVPGNYTALSAAKGSVGLIVADQAGLRVFDRLENGDFVDAEVLVAPGTIWIGKSMALGQEALATAYYRQDGSSTQTMGVGLMRFVDAAWIGVAHSLDAELIGIPAVADIDGDGSEDIVVAEDSDSGSRVRGFCVSGMSELSSCLDTDTDVAWKIQSIAVLQDRDGTELILGALENAWAAPLVTSVSCSQ